MDKRNLRQLIIQYFNEEEIRLLCFDLNIPYDVLPGREIRVKVMELIQHAERHNRLDDLLRILEEERPNVDWPHTYTPIGSVGATYVRGDDRFEYSFPIESETQDFLGDSGIAIAGSLGSDTPKNVTAFEVWLFDKNDIRTRTKILMSEHAFHDEGLKAKLAIKGTEQILAGEGETVVLETVSLILNAIVTEIEYGSDVAQPPKSYFDRLSIKFHVWRKEGD
jgi:hypothetical protein